MLEAVTPEAIDGSQKWSRSVEITCPGGNARARQKAMAF
jgi:hypothetical protein